VQHRDAFRLTRVEKANGFDIHEIHLLQIQSHSWPATLDLSLQLIKVLSSKPSLFCPTQSQPVYLPFRAA
jgi:hypothetical protein